MKVKTSVTLSQDLLEAVDARYPNRSEFIEELIRKELRQQRKLEREAGDAKVYQRIARQLNQQSEEALEDQTEP